MDLARIAKQNLKFSFDKPIEFIDKTGDFSFEGTYITLYKKHAIIWDETGRETKVPWNKLSLETKELIKKDIKARK